MDTPPVYGQHRSGGFICLSAVSVKGFECVHSHKALYLLIRLFSVQIRSFPLTLHHAFCRRYRILYRIVLYSLLQNVLTVLFLF